MKSYTFIARDHSGKSKQGVRQGSSSSDVVLWLREQGLFPISVNEMAEKKKEKAAAAPLRGKIKSSDMAAICWQLNAMVDGGIPITAALQTISEDVENYQLRYVLGQLLEKVQKGERLSKSMGEFPNVFNSLSRAVIMAGETGGDLGGALKRLAEYYESKDKLRKKVQGAMAYPAFVMVFIVLIVIFVMGFIVPRFRNIFEQIGDDLPAFTQGFMNFYDMLKDNILYIVGGAVFAVIVGTLIFKHTKRGHCIFSRIALSFPLIGKVINQAFVATFCKTMGTLLAGGVSILEVLDIISGMTENDVIKAAIVKTRENITNGSDISSSMSKAGFFPNMVVKMAQVGEESGSLAHVLERTSKYYEQKVDSTVGMIMSLMEPIMIVTVGAIVLVVVLALYLPIFSMTQ